MLFTIFQIDKNLDSSCSWVPFSFIYPWTFYPIQTRGDKVKHNRPHQIIRHNNPFNQILFKLFSPRLNPKLLCHADSTYVIAIHRWITDHYNFKNSGIRRPGKKRTIPWLNLRAHQPSTPSQTKLKLQNTNQIILPFLSRIEKRRKTLRSHYEYKLNHNSKLKELFKNKNSSPDKIKSAK